MLLEMEKSSLSRIEDLSEITRHRKTSGVGLSVCAGVTADLRTGVAVGVITIASVGVIDGIGVSVDVTASASIGVGFDAKVGLGVVAGAGAGSSAVGSFDTAVEVDQIAPTMSLAYRTGKNLFSLDT